MSVHALDIRQDEVTPSSNYPGAAIALARDAEERRQQRFLYAWFVVGRGEGLNHRTEHVAHLTGRTRAALNHVCTGRRKQTDRLISDLIRAVREPAFTAGLLGLEELGQTAIALPQSTQSQEAVS